jgi:hypothetical protein
MSSSIAHVAAAAAVLALFATGLIIFPKRGLKGLSKSLALATSLAVVAAFLVAAARSFGP